MENIDLKDEIINNKEGIVKKIYTIRGVQVMLDSDLALLYGYETKKFNQQVKRNMERFPEDFMFQLNMEELITVRSQFVTSQDNSLFSGQDGGRRYLPYVFTEQGVYMLATVLKSDIAVKQSILIIRTFKEMRHYLVENRNMITNQDYLRLSMQVNDIANVVQKHEKEMVTKSYLDEVMEEFISSTKTNEYLLLNGERFSADLVYEKIYGLAKKSIYIIDNYIGVRTLVHLKNIVSSIMIIIFSDNVGKGLTMVEFNDFKSQYPNVNIGFQTTNNKYHDRYIILDYGTTDEVIYHCGASSKDVGNKITSIAKVQDISNFQNMIQELLLNPLLLLK